MCMLNLMNIRCTTVNVNSTQYEVEGQTFTVGNTQPKTLPAFANVIHAFICIPHHIDVTGNKTVLNSQLK